MGKVDDSKRRTIKLLLTNAHGRYTLYRSALGDLRSLIVERTSCSEPDTDGLKDQVEQYAEGPEVSKQGARRFLTSYVDDPNTELVERFCETLNDALGYWRGLQEDVRGIACELQETGLVTELHPGSLLDDVEQLIGTKPDEESVTEKTVEALLKTYR